MPCWMSCKRGDACRRRYRRTTVKAEPAPDPAQRCAAPALLHNTHYACVQVLKIAGESLILPASCLTNVPLSCHLRRGRGSCAGRCPSGVLCGTSPSVTA